MTLKNPYWTAGALEGKAYIERDADQRLRKELSDNQRYVFLFGPRHSGTSSLIAHCMDSLSPGQYCCTRVDLSKLPHTDYSTLIGALLETIANDTALDKQEILTEFPEDTILSWLSTFPQRLILFLDEVQVLGSLSFRDQIFGKLRFLFNVRVENEQFSRLQVVLSGASHPERLIPFNLATPFVGGGIAVPLLSTKQVEKLTWDLESAGVQIDGQVAALVYQQTAGIIQLSQIILHELWNDAQQTHLNVGISDVERVIDRLVATAEQSPHFTTIYQTVTEEALRLGAFLRFVKGDPIDPGLLQDLTLTGLCDPERPYLCPIYERVFGPNGTLDLGLARMRHSQITHRLANDPLPSQTTPQVQIELPREARREASIVTKLPLPAVDSGQTPQINPVGEPAPLRPLPGVVSKEVSSEPTGPRRVVAPSRDTPLVQKLAEMSPVTQSTEVQALPEPPLPGTADSSGDLIEIDQAEEDEPTWVEDPVKRMTSQIAAARADAEQAPAAAAAEDPQIVKVRGKLNSKLMFSAELDSFCASFFPHVAQKFAPGMSRAEKTELLLSLVAASEISKRLREWTSRLELHQEVVSSVTSARSGPVAIGDGSTASRSGKSPPRAPELGATPLPIDPSVEEPISYKPPPNSSSVAVGLVLANRYFLTSEVGKGPVATVWNAYDRIKDEQVALKLIYGPSAENASVLEVFWRSAQQMSALSHPAIVGVLNKPREESDIHYVVVEFLSGGNLRQWVHGGKLTRGQLLRVLQRLGAGLQYAHERRVLHRNIKPTNILFDSTGHARLTDFNVVWPGEMAVDSEARSDRLIYMAPEEQLSSGNGDPRADVYSLGMCSLFALHGQELPSRVVQDRISFIDQLDASDALKAVLRRATAASPLERFASAAEFCRALEFDSPALPGISARNSVQMPIIQSERSSPTEQSPALPSSSARPAPALPATPSVIPAPPIPSAPYSSPAPNLPTPQVISHPSPMSAPLPVLSAPPELFSHSPEEPSAQGRSEAWSLRRPSDNGELPPVHAVAAYGADAERMRTAALHAQKHDSTSRVGSRSRKWQPFAFAAIALLAIAGASFGYWWGGQKANQNTAGSSGSPTTAENPTGPTVAISRPLRVEALLPPAESPPQANKAAADDHGAAKTSEKPAVSAKPAPALFAMAPTKQNPLTGPAGDKPAETAGLEAASHGKASGSIAAGTAADTAKPVAAPPLRAAATDPPQPATALPTIPMLAPTRPAAAPPISEQVATKPAPAAAAKPAPTAVAKPAPAPAPVSKPAPVPAKPAQAPVKPASKPTAVAAASPKATPSAAASRAKAPAVQRPKAPISVAVARPTPPPPARPPVAAAPAKAPSPDAEATLQSAQTAFVRGQHQQAISMAMQVTTRGGADGLKAWRFVGNAACSVKSAQLATSAYNHLRDPEHRRLLVDLCRRNSLNFNGNQFVSPED